jgi:hypothetical protein
MRFILAWIILIQTVLSEPFPDNIHTEPHEPRHDQGMSIRSSATTLQQDASPLEPKDTPLRPTTIDKRDENLPGTKSYAVWVTDRQNQSQVNETRKWLEGLVKDKSQIQEMRSFTWETAEEMPEKELQKLWDEGRYDQEIEKYVLDPAGYTAVSDKKDWIRSIDDMGMWKSVEMIPVPEPNKKKSTTLKPRKVEWGEWEKQEDAGRDLVQASRYE